MKEADLVIEVLAGLKDHCAFEETYFELGLDGLEKEVDGKTLAQIGGDIYDVTVWAILLNEFCTANKLRGEKT